MLLGVPELRSEGPSAAATRVEATLSAAGPFWLHLDVDVLDAAIFAATDYPMPGGLDWEETRAILAPLLSSPALIGTSLGCYNPEKDPGQACGRALVEALRLAGATASP